MKKDALKSLGIEQFVPDYDRQCTSCGASPVVTGMKEGRVVYVSSQCGACTFVGAEMWNPKNWNKVAA